MDEVPRFGSHGLYNSLHTIGLQTLHSCILPFQGMMENENDFDQDFNLVAGVSDTRIFNLPRNFILF